MSPQGGGSVAPTFPLSISSSGRYIQTASGSPFFLLIDSAWSAAAQLTQAQMDTYLNDRQSRGFSAFIVNLIEHDFTSQTPAYQNANGNNPFSTMTDFSTAGGAYWNNVDYLLSGAKSRGMAVFAFPAYWGANSTEGWQNEISADTAAHLQAYGAFLMNRYGSFGNVVWGLMADFNPTAGQLSQDWNIVTGMRSVRTDQLIYAKGQRGTSGYQIANGQTGWNVNNIYTDGTEYNYAATEYARTGPIPFFLDEGYYDGEGTFTPSDCRRQIYAAILSGACGSTFGNNPIWTFGCPNTKNTFYTGGQSGAYSGPASVLTSTFLNTTATQHMSFVPTLFKSYSWQQLAPKTGTSLVTSGLGTGAGTICAAQDSGTQFAMIYTPTGTGGFTVNMATFSKSSLRARWYDPTNGTFQTVTGSPFANSGSHAFTIPAGSNSGGDSDWVLVLD